MLLAARACYRRESALGRNRVKIKIADSKSAILLVSMSLSDAVSHQV